MPNLGVAQPHLWLATNQPILNLGLGSSQTESILICYNKTVENTSIVTPTPMLHYVPNLRE